jgi:RNA polymerase sigma-70 factor, ECF subfamily
MGNLIPPGSAKTSDFRKILDPKKSTSRISGKENSSQHGRGESPLGDSSLESSTDGQPIADQNEVAEHLGPDPADQNEFAAEIEKVEAFIRGDVAAFKYIYAKYRQRIFSYCLYITGDKTVAEDAFQEAFTRAYTRRDQLKEPKALKSWLLLITRSVCLNMLRTSKFTPDFVYLDDKAPDDGEGYTPQELTSNPLDVGTGDALKAALQRLAPMYREAFLLREFEGYSYEEISEMTGASVMNVKVRITRAKKMLRKFLEPHYPSQSTRSVRTKDSANDSHDTDEAPDQTYEIGSVAAQWA